MNLSSYMISSVFIMLVASLSGHCLKLFSDRKHSGLLLIICSLIVTIVYGYSLENDAENLILSGLFNVCFLIGTLYGDVECARKQKRNNDDLIRRIEALESEKEKIQT